SGVGPRAGGGREPGGAASRVGPRAGWGREPGGAASAPPCPTTLIVESAGKSGRSKLFDTTGSFGFAGIILTNLPAVIVGNFVTDDVIGKAVTTVLALTIVKVDTGDNLVNVDIHAIAVTFVVPVFVGVTGQFLKDGAKLRIGRPVKFGTIGKTLFDGATERIGSPGLPGIIGPFRL